MREWAKKRAIMKRYEATTDIYDMRYAQEQARKIEAALRHIKMKTGSLILDAGCGTGILFSYVAEKAQIHVGIDISRRTLLYIEQHREKLRSVALIQADVDNLPMRTAVFDYVFAFTVLQNMPNPGKTLGEIKRVAKSTAIIVVTGMKKVFSQESFETLLTKTDFKITAMEETGLQCFVAILEHSQVTS